MPLICGVPVSAANCDTSPGRVRTPPGKNSTSLRLGDIPAGTSEGSRRVTQVPKTFNGNGEKDSIDMIGRAFVAALLLILGCSFHRAKGWKKSGRLLQFLKDPVKGDRVRGDRRGVRSRREFRKCTGGASLLKDFHFIRVHRCAGVEDVVVARQPVHPTRALRRRLVRRNQRDL